MKIRSILVCTVIGAVILFGYQFASQSTMRWQESTLASLMHAPAGVAEPATNPTGSITHFNAYGVFLSTLVSAEPREREKLFTTLLGRQLALDMVVVFLMCLIVERLNAHGRVAAAFASAIAGTAVAAVLCVVTENSYGAQPVQVLLTIVGTGFGFFLTGFSVSNLGVRLEREAVARGGSKGKRLKGKAPIKFKVASAPPARPIRSTPVDLPLVADYSPGGPGLIVN
jgi:hypothetical protein